MYIEFHLVWLDSAIQIQKDQIDILWHLNLLVLTFKYQDREASLSPYIVVFNFHKVFDLQFASFGGFTYIILPMFLFCKNAAFISMDQHNHLLDATMFNINLILSFVQVGESLKTSGFSS